MLDDKDKEKQPKETVKETVKKAVETKDYTVIKQVTLEKIYTVGSIVKVEKGSDIEKYLLTNKFVNKHGISRSN